MVLPKQINSTSNDGLYHVDSGTSMAAPHVAGAVALYIASHPNATPSEIRQALFTMGWKPVDSCYVTINPLEEPEAPLLHAKPLGNNILLR